MNKDDAATLRRIADQIDAAAVAVQPVPEPALPPEPPVGCGWYADAYPGVLWMRDDAGYPSVYRWIGVHNGRVNRREWSDLQPGRPAVPVPAPLGTDEPDVPVGSLAVFIYSGEPFARVKTRSGTWSGEPWSYWTRLYGAPVAVIPAGEAS